MSSMRSTGRPHRRIKADINVVPYIDVMLVLLVIFMVTAPLITPGTIELPSVGQAAQVPISPLEIQISQNGELALRRHAAGAEQEPIDRATLASQVLARVSPDTPVVIAADGRVPYESVVAVMDTLRRHGMTRLGLLVNQQTASGQAAMSSPQTTPNPLPSSQPSSRSTSLPSSQLSSRSAPSSLSQSP